MAIVSTALSFSHVFFAPSSSAERPPKKCLAINYNFVIMARFYEKNLLLFWSWADVDAAGRVRSSGVFHRK